MNLGLECNKHSNSYELIQCQWAQIHTPNANRHEMLHKENKTQQRQRVGKFNSPKSHVCKQEPCLYTYNETIK